MKSDSSYNFSRAPFEKGQLALFISLGVLSLATVLAAFATQLYFLALTPFALIIAFVAVINFKNLYYLLLVTLPLSMELELSPSLSTDLPDEPLMAGLMLITFLYLLLKPKSLPTGFLGNILMVLLGVHLFWTLITSLNSVNMGVSLKLFLSKIWYATTFVLLTAIVIRTRDDLRKAFWCIYIPLTVLILQVFLRQAYFNFSFEDINKPMWPFFRNHVNYAAILTVFFPLIWLARGWYPHGSFKRRLLSFSLVLYVLAIYLSYTRTCYLGLLLIGPVYLVIKHKMMKPTLSVAGIALVALCIHLFTNNNYLKYAPNFSETIYHDDFNQHLSSTFEGKDVSSMERVYRWIAATRMFADKPLMGFGPKNFYPYYKSYTVTSFETYVSDNPERSTAHNYPLLLLVEQGAIGLVIFIVLTIAIFVYGENLYHSLSNTEDKRTVLALLIVVAMVYVNLMLSDLLESDKVGPFFFMSIALLASCDIRNRSTKTKGE